MKSKITIKQKPNGSHGIVFVLPLFLPFVVSGVSSNGGSFNKR